MPEAKFDALLGFVTKRFNKVGHDGAVRAALVLLTDTRLH